MLPLGILLVGLAVPAAAFAFPLHSTARHVLATGIMWWTLLLAGVAWMAHMNYSVYTRVEGTTLRLLTIGGRRTLDLQRLDRIRSLSMWGRNSTAHLLRLHTSDGHHATVVADMTLSSLNRKNFERERKVREALRPHAHLADERGRWWLGAGPRPPRAATVSHFLAMLGLYLIALIGLLVVLVAYLAMALY